MKMVSGNYFVRLISFVHAFNVKYSCCDGGLVTDLIFVCWFVFASRVSNVVFVGVKVITGRQLELAADPIVRSQQSISFHRFSSWTNHVYHWRCDDGNGDSCAAIVSPTMCVRHCFRRRCYCSRYAACDSPYPNPFGMIDDAHACFVCSQLVRLPPSPDRNICPEYRPIQHDPLL